MVNHQRLMMAMKQQNIPLSELPWHNTWTRFSTPAALALSVIILFTAGFEVFTRGNWSTSGFVSSYLDIGLVTAAFLLWKFFKKTRFISLSEIPLREVLDDIKKNPEPAEPTKKAPYKYLAWMWD